MNVPSVGALTTTNRASTSTASKTNAEMMIYTLQSYANLLRQKNAQNMIDAKEPTTELSVCITKISTKPSFATASQIRSVSANTVTIAPLRTQLKT
jgi:hypothetical protein